MAHRYAVTDLITFATEMLSAAGLDRDKAGVTAATLVEGDLLGHDTHGLQLLGPYLAQLHAGLMENTGEPEVVADRGGCVTWNGRRLPGAWLVHRALDLAVARAPRLGVVTVVIRNSHHIGCLAAYLRRATDENLAVLLMSSEPSSQCVAPFGGTRPVYATDPIAVGWPMDNGPVLLDISSSITTRGLARRRRRLGDKLPGKWAMDHRGDPTDDPSVIFGNPPGTLLPVGGVDHGYKGFALALMVEMLTSALAGSGRADSPAVWSTSVFLQVLDPEAFGGRDAFLREAGVLADACRSSPVAPWFEGLGNDRVRLPGEAALARRAKALADGLELFPTILADVEDSAVGFGIPLPIPIA